MSKRINPVSFRLGLSQPWNVNTNFYGKKFDSYTYTLQTINKLTQYALNSSENFQTINKLIRHKIHNNYWITIIQSYSCDLEEQMGNSYIVSKHRDLPLHYWTKTIFCPHIYNQNSYLNSAAILFWLIKTSLTSNRSLSVKAILNTLETDLSNEINKIKIKYNLFGTKIVRIRGIKICCKGRLSSIRNPLTQTIKKIWGSVPSPKLNSYIDYAQDYILTKQGSYGLQIWIFYS